MIYFVDESLYKFVYINQDKFNHSIRSFLTAYQIGDPLFNGVLPPENITQMYFNHEDDKFFYYYMNYLLSTTNGLNGLMDIMIGDYYNGIAVILTVLNNDFVSTIVNVIENALRERYGVSIKQIMDIEDFKEDIFERLKPDSIPIDKIPVFNMDKERYVKENLTIDDCNELMQYLDYMEKGEENGNMG